MVRTGELGHGKQIRVGSVRTAIAAVAKTIAMDRGEMPLHNKAGEYQAPLSLMLEGFKREDSPSEKKLAVGVDIPEECCRQGFRSKSQGAGHWRSDNYSILLPAADWGVHSQGYKESHQADSAVQNDGCLLLQERQK